MRANHGRDFIDAVSALLVELTPDGRVALANRATCELLGLSEAEVLGCAWFRRFVPAEVRARAQQRFARILAGEPDSTCEFEHRIRSECGTEFLVSWRYGVRRGSSDAICTVALCGTDVTRQRQSETTLRLAGAVFETTAERITITDTDGTIVAVNPAFTATTGYPESEAIGSTPRILKSDRHDIGFYETLWAELGKNDGWSGEIWNRRKNGEVFPEWLSISSTVDRVTGERFYIALAADISAAKRSQEKIEFIVNHDPLTGLPNKKLCRALLERALDKAQADRSEVAVFVLDLDNFKTINDSLSHQVGDKVLHALAHRLKRCIGPADTLARLGGDEFILVVDLTLARESVDSIAARLLSRVAEPLPVRRHKVVITASIGVSTFPESGRTVEELIRNADAAVYAAKEQGRNCYQLYQQKFTHLAFERLSIEAKLWDAINRDELRVFYQPQLDVASAGLRGVEALIRWQHPDHGILSPGHFLPMIEGRSLMKTLDTWVLTESCAQAGRWLDANLGLSKVAVNVCPQLLADPQLPRIVERALQEAALDPAHLEIEITENFVMRAPSESLRLLNTLRQMGISLAIDDFGTGHSSLAYLKSLPIQKLKIDRSFVQDIAADADSAEIVGAIIALGRSLRLRLTAEGVETQEQRDILEARGCDELQGFLLGAPMPATELEMRLQRFRLTTLDEN